jgi:hypothetical protein
MVWSRRRRLIARHSAAGTLAVALVALAVAYGLRARRYTPGENVEGLTRSLDRSLIADTAGVTFTDVTRESGIDFIHFGGTRSTQLPEDMGSGAAWGDYDGDGLPDLYVCAISAPLTATPAEVAASPVTNRLYRNLGGGRFADVTDAAGVGSRAVSMGAAWGDMDGDGDADLVVTRYGGIALYRNEGNGRFADVSREAGLTGYQGFWTGVSWADYDANGFLDFYVCGYVQYRYDSDEMRQVTLQYSAQVPFTLNPSSYPPERNLLFRNNGNGTFTETAASAGIDNPEGRSLSAAWCDFDMDGRPDLYVANDISDNAMFRNLGNGKFEDISHSAWVADYRGAMGLAIGDWNNDGDQDIFVTHWLAQENALYDNQWISRGSNSASNKHALRFMDLADQYGLGQISLDYVKWGTSFFDFDNDGRLDLLAVSGSTFQEEANPTRLVPMNSMLFWNKQPEGFYDVGARSGDYFSRKYVGRGAAFADFDGDGDVDVFIVNHGARPVLLRNDGGNRRNWLAVRVRSRSANTAGLLSVVRIRTASLEQVQSLGSQSSYLSQNATEAYFGLGAAQTADEVEVRFPGGSTRKLANVSANRVLVVDEDPQLTRR